jgi:uncharacterized membrane protein (DUF2068 family)
MLALAVLMFAAANFVRAARAGLGSAYLAQLELPVSPAYLGASGLVWGAVFSAAAFGLWRLRPWGRWLALAGICLYHLPAWAVRLMFDTSTYARQLWPWEAVVTVCSVALTWGILWRPRARAAFQPDRSNE